jgi:hypothetical protein
MTGKGKNRKREVIERFRTADEEVWYPCGPKPCIDFSLHAGRHIRMIKVRYPTKHLAGTREVAEKYEEDLAAFRKFGYPDMVAHELILKEPGPVWRRFIVRPDSLEEVPCAV